MGSQDASRLDPFLGSCRLDRPEVRPLSCRHPMGGPGGGLSASRPSRGGITGKRLLEAALRAPAHVVLDAPLGNPISASVVPTTYRRGIRVQ